MRVLLETSPTFARHVAGIGHPEAPERLQAVARGVDVLDLGDDLVRVEPPPATRDEPVTVPEPGSAGLRGPNARDGLRGPNARDGLRGPNARDGLRGPNARDGLRGPNAADGVDHGPEAPTTGGPGRDEIEAAARLHGHR